MILSAKCLVSWKWLINDLTQRHRVVPLEFTKAISHILIQFVILIKLFNVFQKILYFNNN